MTETAQSGHFYAIGVGPGAPDLLTLRAAHLIESSDVVIAPRSERAAASLALETVRAHIRDQEVVEHVYPMARDEARTRACWAEVGQIVAERTAAGKSVVQITIGDPLVYSTSCYLLPSVLGALPAECVHLVPGISAFQASASLFTEPLTLQEDRLTIMPATDMEEVERAMDSCETLVLYKVGRRVNELAELLERKGLSGSARLVCYAGQGEKEFATRNLNEARHGEHGYMATAILHLGRRGWKPDNREGRTADAQS